MAHLPQITWTVLPSALFHLEPARRLQNLRLADVQLTPGYAHLLFTNMPNLRWLSLDGDAEIVRAAVQHWCAPAPRSRSSAGWVLNTFSAQEQPS